MILEATNVSKTYSKTRKKSGFSLHIDEFHIEEGSFTAILGPNGSGKSTFLKLILNLIFADKGTINLLDTNHSNKTSRREISYLPENFSFPKNFTLREILQNYSEIDGSGTTDRGAQINHLANTFNVDYLDKKISELSKGMRQTGALMNTFLGEARFYILDEPFNGLDAVQKKTIMEYIFDLQKHRNVAILITTHILSDIEKTCDMLHLIKNGAIIDSATREKINEHFESIEAYYLHHFETKKPAES